MVKCKTTRILRWLLLIAIEVIIVSLVAFHAYRECKYLYQIWVFDKEDFVNVIVGIVVFLCVWNFVLWFLIALFKKKKHPILIIIMIILLSFSMIFELVCINIGYCRGWWKSQTSDINNFAIVDDYVSDTLNLKDLSFKEIFDFEKEQIVFYNYNYYFHGDNYINIEYLVILDNQNYESFKLRISQLENFDIIEHKTEVALESKNIKFDQIFKLNNEKENLYDSEWGGLYFAFSNKENIVYFYCDFYVFE